MKLRPESSSRRGAIRAGVRVNFATFLLHPKFPLLILFFWLQGGVGSLAHAQIIPEELLSNPDAHELPDSAQGHLFGSWGGVRTNLLKRGVKLDLHSISDFLWNIESAQKERTASWNRVRGTVDIDFGKLVHIQGLSLHVTGV